MKTIARPPGTGGRSRPRATRGRDRVLDRYTLLERLGAGGFGTVWLAHDERLHRDVAVKRIPRVGADDRDERRRAAREALAAARLSHPAIVALYEAGADDDAYYLVTELVAGQTLAELYAEGALDDRELLRLGVVLADALAHAHARGVVHRDVKPQNAIVPAPDDDEPGRPAVKLTDFGVARIAGEQALTRTGDVVGTLAYMAPEQLDGAGEGPADLYALALTIYEGLAGSNPMRGATPADTARRIGGRVPPLARARPDLPPALCGSLDRALAAAPGQRGSLADLREAFAGALGGELPARRPRRRRLATRAGAGPLGRRQRLIGAAVAAALAAALTASLPLGAGALSPGVAATAVAVAVALFPRAGFLAFGALVVGGLAIDGQPGTALLLLLAFAPVPVVLPTTPWLWAVPAAAPLLGVISLAGAFPAAAGRHRTAWPRVAVAALGLWWLAVAELLYGRRLLLGAPTGSLPRADWQASVPDAFDHALAPLFTGSGLLTAAVWAGAALLLPVVVRGGRPERRAPAALAWAAALLAASSLVAAHAHGPSTVSLVAGAAAAAGLAMLPLVPGKPGRATLA